MSKKSDIKNIIFDFGGVLLDIDYHRTYESMSQLLGISFIPNVLPTAIIKIMNEFETGKINPETFLWNIQRLAINEVPHGKNIIGAWNAMLIGWDPKKFDMLLHLKDRYRVFLLSNTNQFHLDWVYDDLKTNYGITDFDDRFFEKTFYSHLIGFRKPEKEIYKYVEKETKILATETIFIDDMLTNIEGALAVGWNVYHHDPEDDLSYILKKKLKILY